MMDDTEGRPTCYLTITSVSNNNRVHFIIRGNLL